MSDPYEQNRRAWDRRAAAAQTFARPARDEDFEQPLKAIDASGWLGDVRGRRVLCLAAGGGKAGPLLAAAGAAVTVVDLSGEMLALDRQVAARRGLNLRLIQTSMDDLSMLDKGEFDIVSQPVSTCYVPQIEPVFREVARVLVPGGLYVSQHKQPASLQADITPSPRGYELSQPYYRQGPLPPVVGSAHREEGTLEYLHRWEQIVGGMCRAGFVIEDFAEPCHGDPAAAPGTWGHRSLYVAPYLRIKARRRDDAPAATGREVRLWTP